MRVLGTGLRIQGEGYSAVDRGGDNDVREGDALPNEEGAGGEVVVERG